MAPGSEVALEAGLSGYMVLACKESAWDSQRKGPLATGGIWNMGESSGGCIVAKPNIPLSRRHESFCPMCGFGILCGSSFIPKP